MLLTLPPGLWWRVPQLQIKRLEKDLIGHGRENLRLLILKSFITRRLRFNSIIISWSVIVIWCKIILKKYNTTWYIGISWLFLLFFDYALITIKGNCFGAMLIKLFGIRGKPYFKIKTVLKSHIVLLLCEIENLSRFFKNRILLKSFSLWKVITN